MLNDSLRAAREDANTVGRSFFMCRKQARLATVLAPLLASSVLMAASAHAADKPVAATTPPPPRPRRRARPVRPNGPRCGAPIP
jgi:hypothetical protein